MTKEQKYKSQQKPVLNKAGEGSGDFPKIFGEKAEGRSAHYAKLNEQVMAGDRPVLGGSDRGDKWFAGQLGELAKSGFLPEEAGIYTRSKEKERILGYNSVSAKHIFDTADIKESLENQGVKYARVAGEKLNLLKKSSRVSMEKQVESANATIAIPGDLYAMQEMLHLFEQKLEGKLIDHPLIIENPVNDYNQGFWDELLRGLKIFNRDDRPEINFSDRRRYVDFEALAHDYGIYISENRKDTLKIAKAVVPQTTPHEEINVKPFIPEGAVLFVATGTMRKYKEIEGICKANGMNVKVRSIFELLDTYVSPDEDRHTYEGNVAKKVEAAFDSWHKMSEEERVNRLQHLGITKKQAFIVAEDSGFHFAEQNLVSEDEFRKIAHAVDLKAPFPGVETGPATIGSDGIKGFMQKVKQIFDRREAEGKAVDHGLVSKSIIALAPLQQESRSVDIQIINAEITGKVTFSPSVSKNGVLEIANYLIPDHVVKNKVNKQTEAELGEKFFHHHSPRAMAMRGMALEVGMPKRHEIAGHDDHSHEFRAGILLDSGSYLSKEQAKKMEKKAADNGFQITACEASVSRPDDIQRGFLANTDGIVVALDPEKAKANFWENTYLFTSLIVAEQTHDKYKFRKPLYLVNPKDKDGFGAFDYLEDLVYDCHHKGTVPENPESLFKSVNTLEEAEEKLKQDRLQYRRFHLPAYATQEEANEPEGRKGKKDFNVAVFCSASNKNSGYLEATDRLVESLVNADFGVVSGAGGNGMMERITNKVLELRGEHLGSNSPHIQNDEGDVRDKMTQFLLARNIYERMEYMIDNSDAFAIMAGGTGTIQELALLAVLKKRAIEGDDYAKDKMHGKEIVIVNSYMDSSDKGFYDKLKEIVDINDEKSCDKLGIHFVRSTDEATKKLKELRTEKLGDKYIPEKPMQKHLDRYY